MHKPRWDAGFFPAKESQLRTCLAKCHALRSDLLTRITNQYCITSKNAGRNCKSASFRGFRFGAFSSTVGKPPRDKGTRVFCNTREPKRHNFGKTGISTEKKTGFRYLRHLKAALSDRA